MNTPRALRPIPIALTALVAFFSALAALAVSGGMNMAQAHGNAPHHARAPMEMSMTVHSSPVLSAKAVALRTDMRKLWEDHITWTRLAIISLEGGTPDTDATVARLLQNQTDIGNAIKPFYGQAAGNELTKQLREHILIAADLISAAKAGDQAKLADAQARWQENADGIAALLHSVNRRYWKLPVMKAEMQMHLKLTTEEAVARLQGNWTADVAAYDKVHDHILHMSDLLSSGLIKQFRSASASPRPALPSAPRYALGADAFPGKDRRSADTNQTCAPKRQPSATARALSAGAASSSPTLASHPRSPRGSPTTRATTCTR